MDELDAAYRMGFRRHVDKKTDPLAAVDREIGLLGDTHGNFPWTKAAVEQFLAAGLRQIHVLGDFGFVWHGGPRESHLLKRLSEVLSEGDARLFVTGGNHEGYAALARKHPADEWGYRHLTDRIVFLPRGWRGRTRAGTVVASLGGANSVDRYLRTPPRSDGHGGSWWPEESITEADLKALGSARVDVLLGHEAPWSRALEELVNSRSGWKHWELKYAEQSRRMFQRAVEQVEPKLVVSGHYHRWLRTVEVHRGASGRDFKTLSVILDRDGSPDAAVKLIVDRRDIQKLNVSERAF